MQFRRWNIRKNATRDEWQQYFSTTRDQSVPTSLDVPVTTFWTVILNKSTTSKKRASRWASRSLEEPCPTQSSGSTPPRAKAQPLTASMSIEPMAARPNTPLDIQDFFMDVANTLHGTQNIPENDGPSTSNMFDLDHLPWSPQDFFNTTSESARSANLDLIPNNSGSFSAARSFQSSFLRHNHSDGDVFQQIGLPAESHMILSNLLKESNSKQGLPSVQLE